MAERKTDKDEAEDVCGRPPISIPARNYGFPPPAFDFTRLPDFDTNFLPPEHLEAFIQALAAPDTLQSPSADHTSYPHSPASFLRRGSSGFFDHILSRDDREATASAADVAAPRPLSRSGSGNTTSSLFISAQSDWAPVHEKVVRDRGEGRARGGERDSNRKRSYCRKPSRKRRRVPLPLGLGGLVGGRSKDETREGYLYSLLKWPFLIIVGTWIVGLAVAYLVTRFYVFVYEQGVAWRGRREKLRRAMRATGNYRDWVAAAKRMDDFFGNAKWKEENEFAYYDSKTVRRANDQMRRLRERAEMAEKTGSNHTAVEDLKALTEACVKNNFVGIENPRLYSQTYYGTKNLVQNFLGEGLFCSLVLGTKLTWH